MLVVVFVWNSQLIPVSTSLAPCRPIVSYECCRELNGGFRMVCLHPQWICYSHATKPLCTGQVGSLRLIQRETTSLGALRGRWGALLAKPTFRSHQWLAIFVHHVRTYYPSLLTLISTTFGCSKGGNATYKHTISLSFLPPSKSFLYCRIIADLGSWCRFETHALERIGTAHQ